MSSRWRAAAAFTSTNVGNGYSGGTTVTENSTVSVAVDHALGASTGDLTLGDATTSGTLVVTATLSSTRDVVLETGGGTIAPDAGVVASLGGDITGEGELTKIDDGILILTGTNAWRGSAISSAGCCGATPRACRATSPTMPSWSSTRAATGTYAGDISGTGSLTKLGTGTLVLTGTSDYSGGTNVFSGTLQVSTTSLQGVIQNDAILVFDQGPAGTLLFRRHHRLGLADQDRNRHLLHPAGVNDYFGSTTVSAGTLQGSDRRACRATSRTMPAWSSTRAAPAPLPAISPARAR